MTESARREANRWQRPRGPQLFSAFPAPVRPVSPSRSLRTAAPGWEVW